MDEQPQPSFSLAGSARRLMETVLSSLQNRIDLFALEIQEEQQWILGMILWAAAAIFFCGLAVIFLAVTVVWLTPERYRSWVLIGFSLFFLALAVSAISGLRRILREKPPAFSDSIAELKK